MKNRGGGGQLLLTGNPMRIPVLFTLRQRREESAVADDEGSLLNPTSVFLQSTSAIELCLAGMKPRLLHRGLYFGVLHEHVPDELRAVVLRHQHGDADIDAQHVCVIPSCKRIESVYKAVFPPDLASVPATEISQDSHAVVKQKWQRTTCRARHDAPIDGPLRRRAAPCGIAFHVVGSADSPEVFAIVRKTVVQGQAKKFVSFGGLHGILKIIRVRITLVPEIKPCVRILMRENRVVARDVFDPLVFYLRTRPGIPRIRRHRMSRRTDRKKIDHHQLTEVFPSRVEKTGFGMPTHRKGLAPIQ